MNGFNDLKHPAVFAVQENLTFRDTISASDLTLKIEAFFSELIGFIECSGCKLIGHIKGLVKADNGSYLMCSITSFEEGGRFKGRVTGSINSAVLTVNFILYGIDSNTIESAYQKALKNLFIMEGNHYAE